MFEGNTRGDPVRHPVGDGAALLGHSLRGPHVLQSDFDLLASENEIQTILPSKMIPIQNQNCFLLPLYLLKTWYNI